MSDWHSITGPTLEEGLHGANVPDPVASDAGVVDTAMGSSDHLSVMSVSCQDPLLVCTYQGLPPLSCILSSVHASFLPNFAWLKTFVRCEVIHWPS